MSHKDHSRPELKIDEIYEYDVDDSESGVFLRKSRFCI